VPAFAFSADRKKQGTKDTKQTKKARHVKQAVTSANKPTSGIALFL